MLCPNPDCPDVTIFGVQGEYGPGVLECPKCGTALVDAADDEAQEPVEIGVWTEPGNDEEEARDEAAGPGEPRAEEVPLVELISCDFRHEAELVKTFLEARGVPVYLAFDDCGSANPVLGYARTASVEVRQYDYERALEVLEDFDLAAEGPDASDLPVDADQEKALDGLDDLRAQALRAWRMMVVGVIVVAPVVEPLAFIRSVRLLAQLREHPADDSLLRRRLVRTAWFAGLLSVFAWGLLLLRLLRVLG